MRADEVARSYSDFWGLDPVQLPYGYWFGLDTDRIDTTFSQSFTRRIDRNRVTEVRFDPARSGSRSPMVSC